MVLLFHPRVYGFLLILLLILFLILIFLLIILAFLPTVSGQNFWCLPVLRRQKGEYDQEED